MSTTDATTPTGTFDYTPTTSVVNNSPQATLGKNDFLQLLVTQLQNQDPTSPTDSSTFMTQLAQFSTLEQETNISQSVDGLASTESVTQGVDLIGKQITYTGSDGTPASGTVDGVAVSGSGVTFDVGGVSVQPSDVTNVGDVATSTTTGASQSSNVQSTN